MLMCAVRAAPELMTIKPIHLNALLAVLTGLVLLPGLIAVASLILGIANESAGWLRYRLPEVWFWTFLVTGLASPILGIGTLALLWALHRQRVLLDSGRGALKRRLLILAATTAIVAPAIWVIVASEVFFVAGGNR